MSTDDLLFPKFYYYLDESDPDIMILRCQDGSFVAAFSPDGATKEGIIEAAKKDYWERTKDHWASRGQRATEEHRSAQLLHQGLFTEVDDGRAGPPRRHENEPPP